MWINKKEYMRDATQEEMRCIRQHIDNISITTENYFYDDNNSQCNNCPNNPRNGGNGICHCILGTHGIYY